MLFAILRLLRRHPWFLVISLGFLASGIGSGLTETVVYGNLADMRASPMWFAAMYSAMMIMGVLSLQIGKRLLTHLHVLTLLVLCEVLGLAGLALPALALHFASRTLFVISNVATLLYGSLGYPAYTVMIRNAFQADEMAAASVVEIVTFSAIAILGQGIGAFLYPYVPSAVLLVMDGGSFLIGAAFILGAAKLNRPLFTALLPDAPARHPPLLKLRGVRRRAFLLPILLSMVTAPALALLPSIGVPYTGLTFGVVLLAPTLLALFARSIGQVIGPLLLRGDGLRRLFGNSRAVFGLFVAFGACYVAAMSVHDFAVVLVAVLVAHACSTMVFEAAYTARLNHFSAEETASVSVRATQAILVVRSTLGLAAGWLAEHMPLREALLILVVPALALTAVLLRTLPTEENTLPSAATENLEEV